MAWLERAAPVERGVNRHPTARLANAPGAGGSDPLVGSENGGFARFPGVGGDNADWRSWRIPTRASQRV